MALDIQSLQIGEVRIFQNERCPHGAIKILWSANIGFGEYVLLNNEDGSITGNSELMDSNEDKKFITRLMQLLVEKIVIK